MPPHLPPLKPDEKSALRVSDAAAASGLSRSTLRFDQSGRLRDVTIGRRLILRSDLEALIHNGIKSAA
jgi:hypothetical protein